ncbi:STAS domain-containing protein [Streptomyces sp. NRRL S-87]|uniref:STAS domain-containing protein n=1 Tax=Streptomyces sp. NRRL S-87 TaxID=1463920 RepID=UPI00068A1330|nr:STAS domain-containing protein [Streptomyces sp. NRRL S-87]
MAEVPTARAAAGRRDGERFAVEVRPEREAVVLLLSGELDHDTAEPLREAVTAALAGPGRPRLVVDCAGLRFCDSTGLNVLLRARLAAQEVGGRLELADVRQPVARMFRLTGADGVFRIHADLAAALGGAQGTVEEDRS